MDAAASGKDAAPGSSGLARARVNRPYEMSAQEHTATFALLASCTPKFLMGSHY
jgi:hypothetical protein